MFEAEYTYADMETTRVGYDCPTCGKLLKVIPHSRFQTGYRTPGIRHVYYLNLCCDNYHFFQYVNYKNVHKLYKIACDEDLSWKKLDRSLAEWDIKYLNGKPPAVASRIINFYYDGMNHKDYEKAPFKS